MGFRDILEATTGKSVKFPSANIDQERAVLLDLADRFEAISLRTSVLSVYELRESKISTIYLRSRPQPTGIPQGSTLSPILFLLFASTLLPMLEEGPTTALGFVD
ncbi:hypothetical protein M433DRAFT_160980, partial [Acidomyces richmondensis BFW]